MPKVSCVSLTSITKSVLLLTAAYSLDRLLPLLSEQYTPCLRIVKFGTLDHDCVKRAIDTLAHESRSVQAYFKINYDDDYEGNISIFALREPSCKLSGLSLPLDSTPVDIDLLALTYCQNLQYINFPGYTFEPHIRVINQTPRDKVFRYLVAGLPRLRFLSFDWYKNKERYNCKIFSKVTPLMDSIVGYSTSLKYVRAGRLVWAVQPKSLGSESRLIPLDEWEAAAEIGEPDSNRFMSIFEAGSAKYNEEHS